MSDGTVTRRFRALELDATVRTDRPAVVEWLDGPFGSLQVDRSSGSSGRCFEIVTGDDGVVVREDGKDVVTVPTDALAVDRFCWHLNRLIVEHAGGRLLLHAGSVETATGAVVIAGASGRGKSTLTAALIANGFPYFSDETTAVDLVTGDVDPVPKPIAVDAGSPMARLATSVGGTTGPGVTQWIDVTSLGPEARPAQPAAVVLVSWRAGSGFDLRPISPGEAMLALLEQSFNADQLGRPGRRALARICEGAASYRLTYDALEPGLDRLVDELSIEPPGARPLTGSPLVEAVPVAGELALWDHEQHAMHLLNESARMVWDRLVAGRDVDAISAELSTLTGQPADLVAGDVAELVAQFRTIGLVVGPVVAT